MQTILCATSNKQKFGLAAHILNDLGIKLQRASIDIDEIQGEDPKRIIQDKAIKAYTLLTAPVVVTDDSWSIPALNGFPGPYMKSINEWFKPEDFINLMQDKIDRKIFLHQYVAYHDGNNIHVFNNDIPGEIVERPRGNFGPPIMHVVALKSDRGLTISEVYDTESQHYANRLAKHDDAWHQFGEWVLKLKK